MTRVTTITEYQTLDTKVVNAVCSDGFSGRLVYDNQEARITMSDCDGEGDEYIVHPDDAMHQFLSEFFG